MNLVDVNNKKHKMIISTSGYFVTLLENSSGIQYKGHYIDETYDKYNVPVEIYNKMLKIKETTNINAFYYLTYNDTKYCTIFVNTFGVYHISIYSDDNTNIYSGVAKIQ
jgi:hypothetical protein